MRTRPLVGVVVAALALAVLLALWTATLRQIRVDRARAIALAQGVTDAALDKQAEHTLRLLQQLDQAARFLTYAASRERSLDLSVFLRKAVLPGNVVVRLNVLDAEGWVVASSEPFTRTNFADRQYFRVHQYVDSDALYVDKPLFGRLSNQWNVPLSRRLNDADGRFAGVVLVTIRPGALADPSIAAELGPQGVAAAVGLDNVVRVRTGTDGIAFGDALNLNTLARSADAPSFTEDTADTSIDGVPRWVRMRPLTEYAVTVFVAMSVDDALASYRHARTLYLAGASSITLVLALLSAILVAQARGLVRTREKAIRSQLRYQAALDSSHDAFALLTAQREQARIVDFRFVEVNARLLAMIGRPSEEVIDGRASALLPMVREAGQLERWARVVDTRVALEEEFEAHGDDARARWFAVQAVAVEDGVAITLRDVTARVQAAREMERERAFLRTLLENIPLAVSAKGLKPSNFGQFLFWNRASVAMFGHTEHAEGRRSADLFAIDDAARYEAMDRQAIDSDAACVFRDVRQASPDGVRYLNITKVAIRDAAGEPDVLLAIAEDVTDAKEIRERYRQLALYDSLTGLPNRAHFHQHLEAAVARAQRADTLLGVLFIDIDNFKTVNDTLGHEVGDTLLKTIGERLSHAMRVGDLVSRLGGDEFTVIAEQLPSPDHAAQLCQRVRQVIGEPMEIAGRTLTVTASVGVSLLPIDGRNVGDLLKNADLAMYKAKEAGRNAFRFYSPGLSAGMGAQLEVEQLLGQAIQSGDLFLDYQPQFDVESGALTGLEALVRWQHPTRGVVMPGEFIPLAERTDLIVELGDWVVRAVCRQIERWRDAGLEPVMVAVNIGARHFRHSALVDRIEAALARHGVPPTQLELEITEGVMMQDGRQVGDTFRRLQALGVPIAIDDFGTGYSALSLLRKLPIRSLKIDKSFVHSSGQDADGRAILEAIVRLSRSLGLRTIAEGVETEAQFAMLRALGCDEVQGYLLGRPLTPARVAELLAPARTRPAHRADEPPRLLAPKAP